MKRYPAHFIIGAAVLALLVPTLLLAQGEITLDGLAERFEALTGRVDDQESELENMATRLAGVEGRLTQLEATPTPTPTATATLTPIVTATLVVTATPTLVPIATAVPESSWEQARNSAVEIDGEALLRFNDDHVGKLVYFGEVGVAQSLENGMVVVLDTYLVEHPARLLYDHTRLRIIEGDIIDIVAEVMGLYTYETADSVLLTFPLLNVVELRLVD